MNYKIKKIKPPCAGVIINARQPLGLYYLKDENAYIGIDNSTGHAWIEGFNSLEQCKKWLRNPSMLAPYMEEAA